MEYVYFFIAGFVVCAVFFAVVCSRIKKGNLQLAEKLKRHNEILSAIKDFGIARDISLAAEDRGQNLGRFRAEMIKKYNKVPNAGWEKHHDTK